MAKKGWTITIICFVIIVTVCGILSYHRIDSYQNQRDQIPKIVHYVFGLKKQTEEFNLVYAMSILSAKAVIKPNIIYFWYESEPYGIWWDLVKGHLTLKPISPPSHLGSKQVKHYANKSDIIRMQKLMEYGGIYLDVDTICVRPIDDMLKYDMVMGEEKDYGLCNAIMMAKKDSEFLHTWWKNYESVFQPDGWNEASVLYPRKLSNSVRSIKIYPEDTFFKPSFDETEDIFVHPTTEIPPHLRILHLWDSTSNKYFKYTSIEDIKNSTSLYGAIVRHLFRTTDIQALL